MWFKMSISHVDSYYGWEEEYEKPELTTEAKVKAWAELQITKFNSSLRPHEKPRKLVSVEILGDSQPKPKRVSVVDATLRPREQSWVDSLEDLLARQPPHISLILREDGELVIGRISTEADGQTVLSLYTIETRMQPELDQ